MALIATAAIVACIGGYYLQSGFGMAADLAFAFTVTALVILAGALVTSLLLTVFRKAPRAATSFMVGAGLMIALPWPPPLGIGLAVIVGVVEGFFGASLATLVAGNLREAALSKRILTVVIFAATLAANITLVAFFTGDGSNADLLKFKANATAAPAPLNVANPSLPGSYQVKLLMYGAGTDIRRPEYGKSVAIKTGTVDASKFFKDFTGWKANLRRRYWGFGMDKLPLNGRVWYPDGAGPFPLALIVHGNHNMAEFSDPGYEYLGKLLASRGFILASLDENFLNSGLFHDPPKQQAVRGWMLLEHLRVWREWNTTPGNPFYGKIDLQNVALLGHSRGGEAVATAALFNKLPYYPDDATIKFNYNYPIKSLVAIAPVDGQYKPAGQWRQIENVNYLTLQGANDADVSSFQGSRQLERVRYTEAGPWFKAELYIYRANHGQFNTVWGRSDAGEPLGAFLNLKPLLKAEDQRRIASIYISAFLEATLHNRREYLPLFRDYRTVRAWLPDTYYMSRYFDASYQTLASYNEDPDVATTTAPGGRIDGENLSVWREGRIPWRDGNRDYNGVFLGWNRGDGKKPSPTPVYSMTLPEQAAKQWNLGSKAVLTLSAAVTDETAPLPGTQPKEDKKAKDKKDAKPEPVDFTVEAQSTKGVISRVPLSRFGVLPPPFKVKFTKLAMMDDFGYKKASEPIFQTIDVPLSAFAEQNPAFDPAAIKVVRLRFDRTATSVIILSQIGFEQR